MTPVSGRPATHVIAYTPYSRQSARGNGAIGGDPVVVTRALLRLAPCTPARRLTDRANRRWLEALLDRNDAAISTRTADTRVDAARTMPSSAKTLAPNASMMEVIAGLECAISIGAVPVGERCRG